MEMILVIVFFAYAAYCFLKKSWLFDVCCSNCAYSNKLKWTIKDAVKNNSRIYYFVCRNCNKSIEIPDNGQVMGGLPIFTAIGTLESYDDRGSKRFLPTVNWCE